MAPFYKALHLALLFLQRNQSGYMRVDIGSMILEHARSDKRGGAKRGVRSGYLERECSLSVHVHYTVSTFGQRRA
jgi:hypothetical protein